jgi:hypothetical protein
MRLLVDESLTRYSKGLIDSSESPPGFNAVLLRGVVLTTFCDALSRMIAGPLASREVEKMLKGECPPNDDSKIPACSAWP